METSREFRTVEVFLAALVALPIPFVAAFALAVSSSEKTVELPAADRGMAVPIRVRPVLDLDSPNVALGDGTVKPTMPKAWADPPAAMASLQAPAKIKPSLEPAPGNAPLVAGPKTAPKPNDVAVLEPAASSATPPPEVPTPLGGSSEAVSSAVANTVSSTPAGPGVPGGAPDGDPSADTRKRNAARQYLGRVVSWFTSRFHAACQNLTPEERAKFRASASVTLGADGTVLSFSLSNSGNPEIDGAAERAMQSAQGQQIPPPPEDFPELRPNSTRVTFVCGS